MQEQVPHQEHVNLTNAEFIPAEDIGKPREEKKEVAVEVMDIDNKGNYLIPNHKSLGQVASLCIQQGIAPPHLAEQGRAAVGSALMMCKQFNLPQKAMSKMAFVKGRLTAYGSLYTALAQRHVNWGEQQVFYVDDECKEICVKNKNLKNPVYAAVIRIKAKNQTRWNEYTFSMDDADAAGLLDPRKRSGEEIKESPWRKYVKDMLYHKCKARAYDREYASALEGVEMFEDVMDSFNERTKDSIPRDVTASAAERLESEILEDQ